MKNRKNRFPLCTLHSALCTLFMVSSASAQIPTDFAHVYDSVHYLATPTNGKQVSYIFRSVQADLLMPRGRYWVVVYTKSSRSIEKYMHFLPDVAGMDTVDTTTNPTVNFPVIPVGYLVLVRKTDTTPGKAPILSSGTQQVFMWLQGEYYYAYIRRTTQQQVFKLDVHQTSKDHVILEPIPGRVYLHEPMTQTIRAAIIDPGFK